MFCFLFATTLLGLVSGSSRGEDQIFNWGDNDDIGLTLKGMATEYDEDEDQPRPDACVVLCDSPELSNSMNAFKSVLESCARDQFIFIDPNIDNPEGVTSLQLKEADLSVDDILRASEPKNFVSSRLPELSDNGVGDTHPAGMFWAELGLRKYTSMRVPADEGHLAAALQQLRSKLAIGALPKKIIDGGCPGTDVKGSTAGISPILDEATFYSQILEILGNDGHFYYADYSAGSAEKLNRDELSRLAQSRQERPLMHDTSWRTPQQAPVEEYVFV